MSGWRAAEELVAEEFIQAEHEGKDRRAIELLREALGAQPDYTALAATHLALLELPVAPEFGFDEPDDLRAIRALRSGPSLRWPAPAAPELDDRMLGAWLGRSIGCALGKPVEGWMWPHNGLSSWERQKTYLLGIGPDEWPVRDYFPEHSPAEAITGEAACPASTRDHIAFMESDDDIRYTVLGQLVLQKKGADFTSETVARMWLTTLPYEFMCTAETQSYRNMVIAGDLLRGPEVDGAPADVDWSWMATHLNPYREWIGAQIRVDSYGYAVPGRPGLAAEFAWRDARISHTKNGIYGAMLCAAMIAAAFTAETVDEIVEAGLAEIPATSRLHADLRSVIAICEAHGRDFARFEEVIAAIHEAFGHYDPVHTNNNAAVCVAALLMSDGDFHDAVTFAVMAGWDTDCNGATVGSIVGARAGAARVPELWKGRLNDTLNSLVAGYHPIAISECARRSTDIALDLLDVG